MVWVKSEYAEELAVISAWLSALVPWSISFAIGRIAGGSLIEFHFPFLLVRYLIGIEVPGPNPLVLFPWEAVAYYSNAPGPLAFAVWTIGAAVVAAAVLLSLGLYFFEERLVDGPVDPVRAMGVLLLIAAVVHTIASIFLQFGALPLEGLDVPTDSFPGLLLPIGVLFQYAFGYTLLTVERVEDPPGGPPDDADDATDPGPEV